MSESDSVAAAPRAATGRIRWVHNIPFWAVHVAAVAGVIYTGWSWRGFALAVALYYVRMFGITGAYHRYFAHRSYKTSRAFQFVLAMLGATAVQKGALWWAAHHRAHHKYSDQPEDVHSPRQRGFLWSHITWILVDTYAKTDWDRIKDLAKYPELRWLNKHYNVVPVLFATGLYLAAGWWGLLWGFAVSTTLLWHGTFTVNSLAHIWGRSRYETNDDSKNSFLVALITMGEGWHNNHHFYQRSERQGFFWWEIDMSHMVLTVLSKVGLVWDLHAPPASVRADTKARAKASLAA